MRGHQVARLVRRPRPYIMVRAFALSTILSVTLFVPIRAVEAAPAGPQSSTEKRPSIVETTFESVDATIAAQWNFPDRSPAPLVVFIPAGGRRYCDHYSRPVRRRRQSANE